MVGDLQKYANLLLMELAFVGKIGDQSSVILLCCNSNQRLEAFFLGWTIVPPKGEYEYHEWKTLPKETVYGVLSYKAKKQQFYI